MLRDNGAPQVDKARHWGAVGVWELGRGTLGCGCCGCGAGWALVVSGQARHSVIKIAKHCAEGGVAAGGLPQLGRVLRVPVCMGPAGLRGALVKLV